MRLVLVALKCDLREKQAEEEEDNHEPKKPLIDYKQGLAVAEKIKALRYLGESRHVLYCASNAHVSETVKISRELTCVYRMLGHEEPRRK